MGLVQNKNKLYKTEQTVMGEGTVMEPPSPPPPRPHAKYCTEHFLLFSLPSSQQPSEEGDVVSILQKKHLQLGEAEWERQMLQ